MLSELESYEITEWQAYFRIKNQEETKEGKRAEAAEAAKAAAR